jgi:NAD(P)-dependent dehydrogenase (short-subunit alcohol dehydrogenase family)
LTFLVNHLAPFLLTNILLDLIFNTVPARIVNLSSEAYKQGEMNFDDLGFEKSYLGIKAYGRSKLANIQFTYKLAREPGRIS